MKHVILSPPTQPAKDDWGARHPKTRRPSSPYATSRQGEEEEHHDDGMLGTVQMSKCRGSKSSKPWYGYVSRNSGSASKKVVLQLRDAPCEEHLVPRLYDLD